MPDKKISELTALTGANAATDDLLPIVDISTSETKSITRGEFFLNLPSFSTIDINGGTIDGTPIGATTPSTVAATTISVSSDLSVADKIVHTGDTNTAIRFPADDTVTVETSGVERLRVDSTGKVGIGKTPSSVLDVNGQVTRLFADVGTNTAAQNLATNHVSQVTISANATLTTTVPPAGTTARVIIVTSGVTSRTVIFGTGFKATGNLLTGAFANRRFVLTFVSDGTQLLETSRTIAIAV
jgi:hypothetical protein